MLMSGGACVGFGVKPPLPLTPSQRQFPEGSAPWHLASSFALQWGQFWSLFCAGSLRAVVPPWRDPSFRL